MIELNPVVKEDIKSILAEKSDWEKLRGKSVLISGVNGLIASYLVRTLLYLNDTQDYKIRIYGLARNEKRTQAKWGAALDRDDFHMIYQDVTRPLTMEGTIDIMIHAGQAGQARNNLWTTRWELQWEMYLAAIICFLMQKNMEQRNFFFCQQEKFTEKEILIL